MPKVNFVNEKITVDVTEGEDLRTVARKNGIQLYSGPHKIVNCMGMGMCCSCNVVLSKGKENVSRRGILEGLWKWLNPLLGLKIFSNPEKEVRLAARQSFAVMSMLKHIRRSTGTVKSSGTDSHRSRSKTKISISSPQMVRQTWTLVAMENVSRPLSDLAQRNYVAADHCRGRRSVL